MATLAMSEAGTMPALSMRWWAYGPIGVSPDKMFEMCTVARWLLLKVELGAWRVIGIGADPQILAQYAASLPKPHETVVVKATDCYVEFPDPEPPTP